MKKKLFSLMMLCLLAFTGAYAQWVEVTGSPVYTNYQLPSNFYYNYSLTQQIYTADELADVDGEIRAISYYNSSSTSTNIYTRNMDVYMVLTEKNAFESETDWVAVTEADKVFSGEVVSSKTKDWVTINLDTPFAYDGTKNLLVVIDDNSGNYVSSSVTSWCFETPGVKQAIYIRNNTTNYNPLSITEAGLLYGYKNVLKFLSYPDGAVFSENLPTNSYYKYSLTQQIYTPADVDSINTDITGISFFNVGPEQTRNLDIYFVAVGDETMTEWAAVDSSNLVFSGEVTFASNDWTQIPTKRFLNFDGTYNLAVLVDDNTDVGMAGLQFLMMEEQVANSALYYHSDDTTRMNPDPLNLAGIVGTSEAIRPAVQFTFMPAGYVEIGSGNSGYAVLPFRNQSAYSVSQQIYTAQEIGLAGSLLEIQLYAFTNATTRDIEIYLSHTDANEVAAAWLPVSTSHLVYSGSTTFAVGTWNTITLNTPFEYNGEQNIVMTVVDKTGTAVENAQRTNFLTTVTTNNQAHYAYGSNPYDALNLAGVSGYVMTNKNQIHMQFRVGDIPEAPKDLYVLDMTDTTFVDTLFLGDRPNNAWMRPMDIYSLWNHTGRAINISRFDFTPEDGFFAVIDPETPVQMAAEDTIPLLFTTNITDTTFVDTTIVRQFVVIYDGVRTAGVWPIAVHAYNPVCPDVYELAHDLGTIPALAADSSVTYAFEFTGDPDTIYDNYQLPYSDEPFLLADGKDVVYKFTVLPGQEVMLNASVTGENGKVAVYTEDFYGEPGPMPHNFYAGPQMLVAGARDGRVELVNDPNAEYSPEPAGNAVCTRAAWDLMFSFQGTSGGQQAIATDGSFFYTASWQAAPAGGYTFYKYDVNGTFIEGFDIAGATGIRDLTYDGEYFYGTSGGNRLFILDFTNRTLVGTITCAGLTSRHVAYDSARDGFWSGDWSTLALYSRSGALIQSAPAPTSAYGSAYYKDEMGGEHIYLFCQAGTSRAQVYDYNIATNTIDSEPIADLNTIPGYVAGASSAGGAFIGNYNGKICFFGNVQSTPNSIGIFELSDIPAPTGYVTYWEPNPVIEGLTMAAGTYYLVGSATSPDFTVNIEFLGLPCPEGAVVVSPADNADDVQIGSGINLQWALGNYTTEYRLVFGSTYYCEDVLVDWTSDLAQSYTVLPSHPLYNNTNYFWRVDTRNGNCETQGEVYGFTTTFNAPTNLRATDNSVFVGEDVVMEWDAIQDRTFRKYNIYLNDELIGNTTITYLPGTYTSFTIPANLLSYNMDPGYRVNVTAYYDEGESPYSNTYILKVSGNGTLRGRIWEQDGTTGIGGATVSVNGFNEFGEPFSTTATSIGNGTYSVSVPATNDTVSYVCTASKAGYQTAYEPIQGNPRPVTYNASTQADFILDEVFAPVPPCAVFAEFYPDPEDEDEYVKVTWTMNGGESVNIDFESNDFSQGTFNNTVSNYPWVITTDNVHSGTYAMKSSNAGVASSASAIEATVTLSYDGNVSFWALCQGEGTSTVWDKCIFKIDNVEKFSYGANVAGWNEYTYDLTAGTHTLRWEYNKDSSVDPTGDAMWVDDIHFGSAPGREVAEDRSFQYYRIYRTSCYNDGPYNSDNTVLLGNNDTPADLEFVDVNWKTVGSGVYKWGVSRVYEGNREDYPNGRESEISWTCECIDKDMYLNNVRVTVLLNSADSPAGTTVTFTNLNEAEEANHPMGTITLDETGYYKFGNDNPFRKGEYEVTVAKPGYISETDTVVIRSNKHLRYVLEEIIYGATDLYVSRTGWAMWGTDDPNAGNTGGGGGQVGPWEFSANGYVTDPGVMPGGADASWIKGSQSTWGPNVNNASGYMLADSFTLDAATTINEIEVYGYQTGSTTTSTFTGLYAQIYDGNPMNGATVVWGDNTTNIMTATAFTNCYRGSDGDVAGTTRPIMSVTASNLDIQLPAGTYYLAYGLTGSAASGPWGVPHSEPGIGNTGAGVQYNGTAWQNLTDSGSGTTYGCAMKLSGTSVVPNARHLETYKVLCTNSFGEPIFNENTLNPFCQVATDRLVEGQIYNIQVSAIYSTGISEVLEAEFEYESCENYGDINVFGSTGAQGNVLTWGSKDSRAMWDLVGSFQGTSAGQQAIATDGVNLYTASWQDAPTGGFTFYKYDLNGTFIEGFNIAGATGIRDLTYDGQYFYGTSGAAQIFILDFATRTLVGTINCSGLTSRHVSYDPTRDGFWAGNWTTLALYSRTGALIQSAPAPTSAYGSAYYKDADNVEHLYLFCQTPSGATVKVQVYDYNITTNTLGSTPVRDLADLSGIDPENAIAGGAFAGSYNGKTCFFGNVQQSPNLIGIYELDENGTPIPTPTPIPEGVIGFMIFRDGQWIAEVPATATNFIDAGVTDAHEYLVRVIYGGEAVLPSNNYNYAMSCGTLVEVGNADCIPAGPITASYYYDDANNFGTLIMWGSEERAKVANYNIYRSTDNSNYSLIGSVSSRQNAFRDQVAPGTYYYQVTAVYDNGCESRPSANAEDPTIDYAVVEVTSVGNIDNNVALYPNPTNGLVKIMANGMRHITVVSTLGQVVFDADIEGDEYQINMAQFNTGVYVVRIATENGVSTQRVTVVR